MPKITFWSFVKFSYNLITTLWLPYIGTGVLITWGYFFMNASVGFYLTIGAVAGFYTVGILGISWLKWKRWEKFLLDEEIIIGNIISTINKIYIYAENKAILISNNRSNIQGLKKYETKLMKVAPQIDRTKIAYELANEWDKKHKGELDYKKLYSVAERKIEQKMQPILKDRDKTLDASMSLDLSFNKRLFDSIKDDAEYRELNAQLDKYRHELKGSNQRISLIIDNAVATIINTSAGRAYQRIKLKTDKFTGGIIKDMFDKRERYKERDMHQAFERIRENIRKEVIKGDIK